jgi:hypothetical protein
MGWMIGIDEAGYGPNLGPLVMSSVACRVADERVESDLWQVLAAVVRKSGKDDGRLFVEDSKVVYSSARGLRDLEQQVLALLWGLAGNGASCLMDLVGWIGSADCVADLHGESWYTGKLRLPIEADAEVVSSRGAAFDRRCQGAAVGPWLARSVIVPAPRFNAFIDRYDSKGTVLAHGLAVLLRDNFELLDGDDPLAIVVDKHGGRNAYAALIQHALPGSVVIAEQEGMLRSVYRVVGMGREVRLTFRPRADSEQFNVALASMVSKYLREALMVEFNAFWLTHVPGLDPTAGYPGDSGRFFDAIRPAVRRLGLAEAAVWRKK